MHFRHLVFATACVSVALTSHATYPLPPPDPPEGWEERVTPGYEPSVEQVVIKGGGRGVTISGIWHRWDEGAMDVLLRLLDDEQWREFRGSILRVIAQSPYPRGLEWIHSTIKESLSREDLSEHETYLLETLINRELVYHGPRRREACIALCLASDNDKAKESAIERLIDMRTPGMLARAEEAIGLVSDEKVHARMAYKLKNDRGYLRAMELVHPQPGEPSLIVDESIVEEEEPEPRPYVKRDPVGASISGHVKDTHGNPLDARILFYYEGKFYFETYAKDGAFTSKWLPPGPFFIEAWIDGYQSGLLASGRDFDLDGRDLVIELKGGPYEDSVPVWMQAAGFQSEDEATQFPDLAQHSKKRARLFKRIADTAPRTPEPSPPESVQIRVTDAGGQPVRQITAIAVESPGRYVPLSYHMSQPAQGAAPETMTSESGEYTVPNPCHVNAEGFARQFVNTSSPAPLELKMTAPARLVIKARDYHGKPVEGARAVPTDWTSRLDWSGVTSSGKQGRIVIDGLPEGSHGFAVALWDPWRVRPGEEHLSWASRAIQNQYYQPWPPRLLAADLRAGEETVVEVTVPLAWGDTVENTLMNWELSQMQGQDFRPKLDEEVLTLGNREKRRMGAIIKAQLAQMPRVCEQNQMEMYFYCTLAPLLGHHAKDIKAELQQLLASMERGSKPDRISHRWVERMVEAVLALGGDRDIAFWAEQVTKENVSPIARLHASAALGRIGTEESAGTWLALLDAARGASKQEKRLTHVDLMTEAIQFASTGILLPADEWQKNPHDAWVDEQYETGSVRLDEHKFTFRRHGDEWLITGIETRDLGL